MEPRGCNQWQSAANRGRKNGENKPKPLPWVAPACLLDHTVSRASAVAANRCGRSPPCEGGGRVLPRFAGGYFFPLQSGHGHWSQPHPVHVPRIMLRFYAVTSAFSKEDTYVDGV